MQMLGPRSTLTGSESAFEQDFPQNDLYAHLSLRSSGVEYFKSALYIAVHR